MISFELDFQAFERALNDFEKQQLPFAASQALNDTARDIERANRQHMQNVFDRPTRWTLNAFYVQRATKTKLVATVERKAAPGRRFYLEVQQRGGTRPKTGIERLLMQRLAYSGNITAVTPGPGMRRTAAGNMSPAAVQRILSGLRAQGDANQNTTARSRKRNAGRARYFVPKPGSRLSPGVYAQRGRKGKLRKMLHFTRSQPQYSKRLRFEANARQVAARVYMGHFARRLARAIETAR